MGISDGTFSYIEIFSHSGDRKLPHSHIPSALPGLPHLENAVHQGGVVAFLEESGEGGRELTLAWGLGTAQAAPLA